MKIQLRHNFNNIVSAENLLEAWQEFAKGKRSKKDVLEFSWCLMHNIFELHHDLVNYTYKHGSYQVFHICDPKPRIIHKACVMDRLLHHAIHRLLYPFFDRVFIADSFSCRLNKGVHKALNRFDSFSRKVSRNNIRTCWVLQCDIRKFFATINHQKLTEILKECIPDEKVMWLLKQVIASFNSGQHGTGLPLGNLTSQLFANVYMNEFDQFVKHKLKLKHYIRYADDFVVLAANKSYLEKQVIPMRDFLQNHLCLELHPRKVSITTLSSGIDFLGWVHFPNYRVLRVKTRKRMMRRITARPNLEILNSYLGLLKHGNSYKLQNQIKKSSNFSRK